ILFGRVAGGLIAHFLGWRWTYVAAAAMLLALAPALVLWLPSMPSKTQLGYGRLMRSLGEFLRDNATLRRASAIQFLLGISYGGFWATVAPMMLALHGFGPAQTGLLAIPGAAGILVSQPAGRWTDRRGAFPIVTAGVCLVLAAYVAFAFAPLAVGAVIAGAVLLDCGLRSALAPTLTLALSRKRERETHCGSMFACFAIFRKMPICARTNFANSSGFIGEGAMPILPNCSRTSFPCTIAFTRAFSFCTTARGVPARAHMPNQSARL